MKRPSRDTVEDFLGAALIVFGGLILMGLSALCEVEIYPGEPIVMTEVRP